ncbi:MAG: hypothetical protein ACRELV_09230 [Longimicrobiales bacterium]
MKKAVLAVATASVVVLGACASSGEPDVLITRSIVDSRGELSEVDDSDVVGAATARTGWGQTGVSVAIAGADNGSQHPWHIHSGTCGSGGPIIGDATRYPVLRVGSNGRASASASLNVELAAGQSYYVNVHESPTDLGTIVACGPLR